MAASAWPDSVLDRPRHARTRGRRRTTRSTPTSSGSPSELSRARPPRARPRARRARRSGCAPRAGSCAPRAAQPAARLLEGTDTATPRVIAVGEVLDVGPSAPPAGRRRRRCRSTCARTIEELLGAVDARLRARARAVRAEHLQRRAAPLARAQRRLLPLLQPSGCSRRCVARRFVESFFGRLDARTASLPATAELMDRHFPGDYRARAPTTGRRGRRAARRSTRSWPRAGTPRRGPALAARAGRAAADRRRPAHAHRPLRRLRHAGRGAARDRARAGAGRDRGDRPQRDLRRAGGARAGGRRPPASR